MELSGLVLQYVSVHYCPLLILVQVNLDMTDSMVPGKLVRRMQNPSYTYDEYLICIGLGPIISSVISKNPSYSGPSYPSSPVLVLCPGRGYLMSLVRQWHSDQSLESGHY